jgi:hypothetical protein
VTGGISGETDQIYRDMTHAEASDAGADPATIATVEIEDMPLAYLPGDALRVRVRVIGDMGSGAPD